MTRPWLTTGNIDFAKLYQASLQAHLSGPANAQGRLGQANDHLNHLVSALPHLETMDLSRPIPEKEFCLDKAGNPVDQTVFLETDVWDRHVAENLTAILGRAGPGAITSLAEAMIVIHALAHSHQAEKIYYRGEHQYGWPLKSRAQRKLEESNQLPSSSNGISSIEVQQIRRFQDEVLNQPALVSEIWGHTPPLDPNDPEWLPVMQHYDEQFGTRFLDITSSIFAGLHFACVDWSGSIDFETDGLLYVFFGHGRYYRYQPDGSFDDEISEFVPDDLRSMFVDWSCPQYLHHFRSLQSSQRELAQDGHFLVQGDFSYPPTFGGKGNFKIRIPRWAKANIIEELWFAGYTPERIIRGARGPAAAERAYLSLARYRKLYPNWKIPLSRRESHIQRRLLHYATIYVETSAPQCAPLVNFQGILRHQLAQTEKQIQELSSTLKRLCFEHGLSQLDKRKEITTVVRSLFPDYD